MKMRHIPTIQGLLVILVNVIAIAERIVRARIIGMNLRIWFMLVEIGIACLILYLHNQYRCPYCKTHLKYKRFDNCPNCKEYLDM